MGNRNRPAPVQGERTAETVQRYVDATHPNPRLPSNQPSDFRSIGELADRVIANFTGVDISTAAMEAAMSVTPSDVLLDLRFQRHVEYLHRLGPRAVGELLAEIGATRSCRTEIDRRLAR